MSDDDGEDRFENSTAIGFAETLGRLIGGEDGAEKVREGAEKVIPPGFDGDDIDAAAAIGSAVGVRYAHALGGGRGQPEQEPPDQERRDDPTVTAREIEQPDGTTVGVRMYVASSACAFEIEDGDPLVVVDGDEYPVPTPFHADEIEVVRRENGFTEAVARAPPMLDDDEESEEDRSPPE